jgi:hypothetical protein
MSQKSIANALLMSLLLTAMLFTACAKKIVQPVNPVPHADLDKSEAALLGKLLDTKTPYTWFAASGQGKVDWEGQRLGAKFEVRIQRDSAIWIQISKFGFEVGRMYVTRDSAFVINRLERSYGIYETEEFLEEYNVPADFDMFASVFTGGAYIPTVKAPSIGIEGESIAIDGQEGTKALYWFEGNGDLVRSMITDPYDREWLAGYGDYRRMKGANWPFIRTNTLVVDGEPSVMDLEYSEIEVDEPQTFPFSIPSHYEKM